jgi:disulfide bond formation protein DsbB
MNIKNITQSRLAWALLSLLSFSAIGIALIAQHFFDMTPCYLCILQRIGVITIGCFSLLAAINPKNFILRRTGYLGWALGAGLGLYAGGKLLYMQSQPLDIFSTCSMGADQLMERFSFFEYIPILFQGSGSCTESAGAFIGVSFETWTFSLFAALTVVLVSLITVSYSDS